MMGDSDEPREEPAAAQDADASAAAASPAPAAPAGDRPEPGPARRGPRNPALVRAWRSGRPVEGTVARVIKGGYEITFGRSRGFCPHSQIDLHRENDPETRVGQSYPFRVTQLRRGGEDVVVSRRVLLEEQRVEEAKAVRATMIEGALMLGRVAGVAEFGAFVDLGAGVMGLAHISELSHARVRRVEDAVQLGDQVRVRLLRVREDGRISLSIKAAIDDPWEAAARRFVPGSVHAGSVTRLADFGAFVELAPGVEALAPASELPPRPDGWRSALAAGTSHEWYVLSLDPRERRISVTLPGGAAGPARIEIGSQHRGRVQRIERYGVFVWLGPGQVGLMPRAWTGWPDADLRRQFHVGDDVEVRVVETSPDGRKIRLAVPGVDTTESSPAPRAEPRPPAAAEPPAAFGTSLADKLRAALERAESER